MTLCSAPSEITSYATSPYSARVVILKHNYLENVNFVDNAIVDNNTKNKLLGYIISWEEVPRVCLFFASGPSSQRCLNIPSVKSSVSLKWMRTDTFMRISPLSFLITAISLLSILSLRMVVLLQSSAVRPSRLLPSLRIWMIWTRLVTLLILVKFTSTAASAERHWRCPSRPERMTLLSSVIFSMKIATKKGAEVEYDLNKVVRCTVTRGSSSDHDTIDICVWFWSCVLGMD